MKVTISEVLQVFEGILAGNITRDEAEDWAYIRMEAEDNRELIYDPAPAEDLIWDGIGYLLGVGLLNLTGEYLHADTDIKQKLDCLIDTLKSEIRKEPS